MPQVEPLLVAYMALRNQNVSVETFCLARVSITALVFLRAAYFRRNDYRCRGIEDSDLIGKGGQMAMFE
jgi:hypothetical protein